MAFELRTGVCQCRASSSPMHAVYTVHCRLAKKFNMKLVYKKTFAEFFKEKYQCRQHRTLLEKMNALEVCTCPSLPPKNVSVPASHAGVVGSILTVHGYFSPSFLKALWKLCLLY